MLDDVHRAHGQPGAIDEAGDVAVEGDVAEGVFRGFNLLGVLLIQVAEGDDLGMAEKGVVIEGDLGVQRQHLVRRGGDERIDLDHRGIGLFVHRIKRANEPGGVLGFGGIESQTEDELPHLEIGQAVGGINADLENLFGGLVGDFLDFNPAFGRGDDDGAGTRAIEKNGEVVFLLDAACLGKIDRLHLATGGAGLGGDEGAAKHLIREVERLRLGFGVLHAALEAAGERALAPAAGVDLRFYDDGSVGQLREGGGKLGGGLCGHTQGDGHAEFFEKGFGLEFVNIHGGDKTVIEPQIGQNGHQKSASDESAGAIQK